MNSRLTLLCWVHPNIGTMRVPEGDLHCQCKLSIFSLSSFGPCIVFWILQKGTCIGKCIFSIFPAVTHQLKCKQTCIEKCRPRHKISMKKWLKILQISKNVNLFPYITTNLHCYNAVSPKGTCIVNAYCQFSQQACTNFMQTYLYLLISTHFFILTTNLHWGMQLFFLTAPLSP